MRYLISLPLLFATCVPAPAATREQAVMDAIEASVRLPAGASPLSGYGRYYADDAPGRVRAVYMLPRPALSASGACEVLVTDDKTRPCTAGEITKYDANYLKVVASEVPAGQRRWVKSTDELPVIADGGCMMVTVEYDIAAKRVLFAQCNGLA